MSFQEQFDKLHAHYQKVQAEPCDNPKDQETHDRLARYDHLHQTEGHTLMCACQQVFGGKPCTCSTTPKEEQPA
jgi:hypothetical protein